MEAEMKLRTAAITCATTVSIFSWALLGSAGETAHTPKEIIPYGKIDPSLLPIAYSGSEKFRYKIAYTGGVKLGELELEIRRVPGADEEFELYALVTTKDSVFNSIYPVRDVHLTRVRGEDRLPYFYEVWQKEGYNYEAYKKTVYDQQDGVVSYQRNEEDPREFKVAIPTHNEFSSFFSSRLMSFEEGESFIVPTFADKKRMEVEVKTISKDRLRNTALGAVDTIRVTPILKFRGLYDKRGDTVIWYTDDECRVPVKITSKLALGSITSTLMSYDNPACSRYTQIAQLKK